MSVMKADEIMTLLPNRYPTLFIDRVDELVPGESITCVKNTSVNEEFFQGHFPDNPLMPGVLIIETLSQAASILILKTEDNSQKAVSLQSVDRAKFRHVVFPGDVLTVNVTVREATADTVKVNCEGTVDNQTACSAVLTFAISDK